MKNKQQIRGEVWKRLREVALPDSRFHFEFSEFIPDFEGSKAALAKLLALSLYRDSTLIFITPDNCLEGLRTQALRDGKRILVPTYGIRRGFVKLSLDEMSRGKEEYASWLDGLERMGRHVSLTEIQQLGPIDFLVSGASVINHQGVRFGKGHGFFDLEWAILFEIGVVDETTPIVAFVHDCQVVDTVLEPSAFDTVCDFIITPSRIIEIKNPTKPSVGILWEKLAPEMLDNIPPLRELQRMLEK